ncbi:unnamed protein product, partial [Meganyctiphanes norvegica]
MSHTIITICAIPLDLMAPMICWRRELHAKEMILKFFDNFESKDKMVEHKGKVSALGTKCSHYGAPLEKGTLCNGRVRCPWHGACFNVETGDIEDFPGLDSIPSYEVHINDGEVRIKGSRALLTANKRTRNMVKRDPENNTTFVVVGGGGCGASAVETLRSEGFTGRLLMITNENYIPYDRPKLSKVMDFSAEKLALRSEKFYKEFDIEILLGTSLDGINTEKKELYLSTGEKESYDKVLIATGGSPRKLGCSGEELQGVFYVRSPEDSNAINNAATEKNVVVVGTSFIGMETAGFLADKATSVTVIGMTNAPFERSLGSAIGARIQSFFEEKGVKFINNAAVSEILGNDGNVSEVKINNGDVLQADVVVVGVGVLPCTNFLKGTNVGITQRGFVPVNEYMETNIPDVYCGGDIASFPLFLQENNLVNIGHWQVHLGENYSLLANVLEELCVNSISAVAWSAMFKKSLNTNGFGTFDDVIISGDLENLSFIAYYCSGSRVVAVASLMKDPAAANYAEMLLQERWLTKDQVLEDPITPKYSMSLKLSC